MTVAELKKELDKYDDNLKVRFYSRERVTLPVDCVSVVTVSTEETVKTPYLFLDTMLGYYRTDKGYIKEED